MIHIDPTTMIGKGSDRACYDYPGDPKKCIKITHATDSKQSESDMKYYTSLMKRGVSWKMLAKFQDVVETDRGEGLVFDKIVDYDGSVSKSLSFYLDTENETEKIPDVMNNIRAMHDYLLNERIIFRDLLPHNILCRRVSETKSELIIIDGIGNSDFIPIADYIGYFAEQKIERKWQRFINTLRNYFKDNAVFMKMLSDNE